MKHSILTLALLLALPLFSIGQGFTIVESNSQHVSLRFDLGDFAIDTIVCEGETMHTLSTEGIIAPNEYGMPDLPTFNRFIAVPQGAKAIVEVKGMRLEHLGGVNIAPSLGSQCENEPERPYFKDPKVYATDALYPASNVVVAEPQSLRGVDVIHIGICPFQFNPVRQEIVVNGQLEIEIRFEGGNGLFGDDRLRSPYWDPILQNNILNYDCLKPIDYHARRQAWTQSRATGCEYLILTPDNDAFISAAQELADYRTRQGILTQVVSIAETGATTPGMLRLWFKEIYNNWDIPPAAVCIIGESGTNLQMCVPAFQTQHPLDEFVASDNPYADVNNDNLPDICFSRLVAETEAELPIFIGKQIEYEYTNPCMNLYYYKHPLTASAWQTTMWFQITISTIAGYLSQHNKIPTRLSEIHAGELSDQWSTASYTSDIVSYFGPNGLGYIPATPGELGGWTGATAQDVIHAFNQGAYIVQHRDHGWNQKWYQPFITVSDFSGINNVGQMPFLISINCRTGQYNVPTLSFTEALMRMTRNGQNAGIVGAISPTGQTYSFGNDIFLWGIWDLFDPGFLPEYGPYASHIAEWRPSFALVSGKYFLDTQIFPGTHETMRTTIYNTYHSHCDAFLRLFTEVPQSIDATFDGTITSFAPFHITAPEGVEIALSAHYDGKSHLLATATGTGEEQTLYVMGFVPANTIKLTMTGLNYLRREENIRITPINGPFVVADSVAVNDGVQTLHFGQSGSINLTLKNYGSETNEAGTATLANASGQMQITQGETGFPMIEPDSSLLIENAFQFTLTDDIPDHTLVPFTITTQSGDVNYGREFEVAVIAPHLKAELIAINDPNGNNNGLLEAGEFASLTFRITNKGHYRAENPSISLSGEERYIRIITPETSIEDLEVGFATDVTFDVFIEFLAGETQFIDILVSSTVGSLVTEDVIPCSIGFTTESFENGVFSSPYWTNDPTHPWQIVGANAYDGTYCAMSDTTITHNEWSELTLTYTSTDPGTLSFYYKVSSEANYDFLVFSIDGEEIERWSGSIDWYWKTCDVSPGTHSFNWNYTKDYSVDGFSDCAWIDYITLPPNLDGTEEQAIHPLTLHPNPTTDIVWIDIEEKGRFTVQVYDGNGSLLFSKQNEKEISFKHLPAGMYTVKVLQNGQQWSRKLIKM
jgi:hypothetical protein